jgi:hypothetical protein
VSIKQEVVVTIAIHLINHNLNEFTLCVFIYTILSNHIDYSHLRFDKHLIKSQMEITAISALQMEFQMKELLLQILLSWLTDIAKLEIQQGYITCLLYLPSTASDTSLLYRGRPRRGDGEWRRRFLALPRRDVGGKREAELREGRPPAAERASAGCGREKGGGTSWVGDAVGLTLPAELWEGRPPAAERVRSIRTGEVSNAEGD